jgi:hypothetical protein
VADTSASSIAINILTSPGTAFAAIREKPQFLFPLALLLLGAAVTTFIFTNGVDFQYMMEQQVAANPDATDQQIAQAGQVGEMLGSLPSAALAAGATVLGVIGAIIAYLLQALYFKVVSLIRRDALTYKLWFSVICFCSMPVLLRYLATVVNLLANDISLMSQTTMNPLAFGNLFGLEAGGGIGSTILMNLDITTIWSLVLVILAYKAMTGKGIAFATAIVLAPALLFFGISAAF